MSNQNCFKISLIILALALFSTKLPAANAFELLSVPIVGGTVVSADSSIAKRTVAIYFLVSQNGQKGAALCTGSILDSSHILTAAHCVQNFQSGYVVFSADQVFPLVKQVSDNGLESARGFVQAITSAKAFPGFPGMAQANGNAGEFVDLAIITFQGGLPASYEPAHFLDEKTLLNALTQHQDTLLSGYGMTSAPNSLSSGPSSSGFPKGVGILRQVLVHYEGISAKQIDIFVGGVAHHNACEGDSGGPALLNLNNEVYVIGVDSRGDCSQHSIYTRVDQGILAKLP